MRTRISNSLSPARRARGWSQAEAAAACGISRQSYSAIEASSSVPSAEIALRLAAAFGVSVEELFRLSESAPRTIPALRTAPDLVIGRRVRLARVGGQMLAFGVGEADRSLGSADGVVMGAAGADLSILPLPERPPEPGLVVAGCDPSFRVIADVLSHDRGLEICWMQRGSRGALEALAKGEAHVAGAHLRDPLTGEYNGPWVERLVPFPCTRIAFASWEQGLLVGAGNPLSIGGVEDLTRRELRLLNREPGSGSRALLDERLAEAHLPAEQITGYSTGARGHMAVAEGIASGLADAGVGIRAAANAFGLDLLPLQTERYELVIPNHFLDLPAVQLLLDTLRRSGVKAQIEALGGYDTAHIGQPV